MVASITFLIDSVFNLFFFPTKLYGIFPSLESMHTFVSLGHTELVKKCFCLFCFCSGESQKNKNRNIEKYIKPDVFRNIHT